MTSSSGESRPLRTLADRILRESRQLLGLDCCELEPARIKQAYRTALRQHPPDRDPDGFRRVRRAYETLSNPWPALERGLLAESPYVDAPAPPAPPQAERGAAALALLRAAASRIPAEALLAEPAAAAEDA
jgi:curved DNA-binding protein CbpA